MITKRPSGTSRKMLVTFELPSSIWAEKVHLVGDFNAWSQTSHRMRQERDGAWRITLELDTGKEFRFRYLIDGSDWQNDSSADKHTRNPYGGVDSIVVC